MRKIIKKRLLKPEKSQKSQNFKKQQKQQKKTKSLQGVECENIKNRKKIQKLAIETEKRLFFKNVQKIKKYTGIKLKKRKKIR